MNWANVRFCEFVALIFRFSGQKSLTVFCRVSDRCEIIVCLVNDRYVVNIMCLGTVIYSDCDVCSD